MHKHIKDRLTNLIREYFQHFLNPEKGGVLLEQFLEGNSFAKPGKKLIAVMLESSGRFQS